MLKLRSIASALAVVCLMSLAANGSTITCPVDVDTYVLRGHAMGYGYPVREQVKSMEWWISCAGLIKFDLSNLSGISANDVFSAKFNLYRDSSSGGMSPETAPAGTELTGTIHALNNSVPLTEDLLPGYDPSNPMAHGVIEYANKPVAIGPTYPVSNNTGPNSWAEADITGIVKDWLGGTYDNNGIEFEDALDPDQYVWYWSSIQASDQHAYLEVTYNTGYNPVLTTTPGNGATIDFENVRVGKTSDPDTVKAENTGNGTLSGWFPAGLGDFAPGDAVAFVLDGGNSEDRDYTYAPGERGFDSEPITLTSNGGNSTITLEGTGVGPEYTSGPAAGSTLDFGEIGPGNSTELSLGLENATTDPDLGQLTNLTVREPEITGPDAGLFSWSGFTGDQVLGKNGTLEVMIEFSPSLGEALGHKSALLTFSTDQGAAFGGLGASFSYTLGGTAVPEPATFGLLALGAGLVLIGFRRRRQLEAR